MLNLGNENGFELYLRSFQRISISLSQQKMEHFDILTSVSTKAKEVTACKKNPFYNSFYILFHWFMYRCFKTNGNGRQSKRLENVQRINYSYTSKLFSFPGKYCNDKTLLKLKLLCTILNNWKCRNWECRLLTHSYFTKKGSRFCTTAASSCFPFIFILKRKKEDLSKVWPEDCWHRETISKCGCQQMPNSSLKPSLRTKLQKRLSSLNRDVPITDVMFLNLASSILSTICFHQRWWRYILLIRFVRLSCKIILGDSFICCER